MHSEMVVMQKRIKWGTPQKTPSGETLRVSTCGRYKILMSTFSGVPRNTYDLQRADGTTIEAMIESLGFAQMAAEYDNDPTWSP